MFSSTKLFAEIPCPLESKCDLPFCSFSHAKIQHAVKRRTEVNGTVLTRDSTSSEPPPKRRKVNDVADSRKSVSALPDRTPSTTVTRPPLVGSATSASSKSPVLVSNKNISSPGRSVAQPGRSAPTPGTNVGSHAPNRLPPKPLIKDTAKPIQAEALLPRTMQHNPAPFPLRLQLLKLAHAELVRLNKELAKSKDPDRKALALSDQELVIEALNEEEKVARENPKVYSNVMKNRLLVLKRMKLDGWKEERLKHIARDNPELGKKKSTIDKKVLTGLSPAEEIALLPALLTPIDELTEHGYVPQPPTAEEISQAGAGVEASQSWEKCDRCDSRFQVFPGRREDGVLTTNGPCLYHWGRKRRPPKQPGDAGPKEDLWTCCRGEMGSKGCTRYETHVFKISDPKRLALVMPFEKTQNKGPSPSATAVAFDCEMGYTSQGMELIRLTATAWPSGVELVDVLVRPLGEILDLNSRFSGVWPDDYTNAIPYDSTQKDSKGEIEEPPAKRRKADGDPDATGKRLRIVNSPAHARKLLMDHLTTTTPLIGHAIDNDLNATRICHSAIVDTVLLFPHPQGMPYRYGLKALSKNLLDLNIQMGGESGHDSKEDARATGELVRYKVAEKWKEMKREGWKVDKGVFIPPVPRD